MSSSNKKVTVPYINSAKKIKESKKVTESESSQAFSLRPTSSVNLIRNSKKPKKTINKKNSTVKNIVLFRITLLIIV